jgi:putative Mg2+ transporter-C (MgtC) family protein
MSYRVTGGGRFFEYRMVLRTNNWDNMRRLAERLRDQPSVVEFRIAAAGD